MTQRAIIWEVDEETDARSITDIFDWEDDRLDLNKRRLMREVKHRAGLGKIHLMIIQRGCEVSGDVTIYERTMNV